MEQSLGCAPKINEIATHDWGPTNWMDAVGTQGTVVRTLKMVLHLTQSTISPSKEASEPNKLEAKPQPCQIYAFVVQGAPWREKGFEDSFESSATFPL